MAANQDALLGLTSLLILIANYGLYRWLGGHGLDDETHRDPLVASALGSLLATNMVLIAGASTALYVAAVVPWLMVSFFTYRQTPAISAVAGVLAWAVWWGIGSLARFFAGLAIEPVA